MVTNKTAVDQTAKDYWQKYFGEYGAQWVREIPRRIRQAYLKGEKTAAAEADLRVAAFGYSITDAGVCLDGAIRSATGDALFSATFDHEGALCDFVTHGNAR